MTLTERIQAQECAVVSCNEARVTDSLVCANHLNEMFRNRLDRTPEGFVPRQPEWLRRKNDIGLPPKDMTRSAA